MNAARLAVITDLDGTLLDSESYSYDASLPAVRRLQVLRVPLVLCSSKTASEIEVLWRELDLGDPFICENGGAVVFPRGYFPFAVEGSKSRNGLEIVELGTEISALRRALKESAAGLQVRVRGFGEMSAEEVSQLTGLALERAALALRREYDEPFTIEGDDTEKLFAALRERGLNVTYGGRLHHVTGGHDKGRAVSLLQGLFRKADPACVSVGLGNSQNDLPLLRAVGRPILVRNADGSYDAEVLRAMPDVERTEAVGPAGWNAAVSAILTELGLPAK